MKVIALERGYYGGKIQDPPEAGGEPFNILEEKHLGKWMQPQGWKPSSATKPQALGSQASTPGDQDGGTQPAYTTKHNGGGRHIVIDADGKKVGDFVGASKEEAQTEADRLIAGGEPYVKLAATHGDQDGGTQDEEDDEGPDA